MSEKYFDRSSLFSRSDAEGVVGAFAPKTSRFGPRFQMGALIVAGALVMLGHHSFYSYLDGKPIDSPSNLAFGISTSFLASQLVTSTLGNAIAYAARVVFSAAIGVAFIQVLWMKLRRRQYSVAQVDALVAGKSAPFAFSALPTWRHAFLLAVVGLMATLMAFLSIVTPGSLRIETLDFSVPGDCTVPTVSLATSNIVAESNFAPGTAGSLTVQSRVLQLVAQVAMNGAPLQPLNPCPFPCRYNISFDAPSASCSPVDSNFDIDSFLPQPLNSSDALRVWNSENVGFGSQVITAMRDLELNPSAVNCTTYNSTYHVTVTHENTSPTTVDIFAIDQHVITYDGQTPRDSVQVQYDALTVAFANILSGTVDLEPNDGGIAFSDNFLIGYSPSFGGRTNHPWAPAADLGTEISTFMQNISVSLLTSQISAEGNSTTAPFETRCWYTISTYHYNQEQLLAAYVTAIIISVICVLIGLYAIHLNGVEESFAFSRIVGAVLNQSLFEGRYELTRASRLTADGSRDGQLRLTHDTLG